MKKHLLLFVALLAGVLLSAGNYSIDKLKLDHEKGFYRSGEEAVVTGTVLKAKAPVTTGKIRALILWENKEIARQEQPLDGKPFRFAYKSDKPGWVDFQLQLIDEAGEVVENPLPRPLQNRKKLLVGEIGALFDAEAIKSTAPEPEDFDAFWKAQREKLDKVEFKTQLTRIDSGDPAVEAYSVVVETGADRPVTAYLAFPAGAAPKSLPGYVSFLSLSWCDISPKGAISIAKKGMIALHASWHGLPVGQPKEFYLEEGKKFKKGDKLSDPTKWSMGYIYIRVMRALDYLKSRPEWNGRDLVVQGGSLAGAETAAAAALDPAVTLAFIHTPCFAEFNADLDGRHRSLPIGGYKTAWMTPKIRRSVGYYDIVNHAKRIKCEVYFCTGFADQVCPPSNVYAAYNNVPAGVKKVMWTNPRGGHYGTTRDETGIARLNEFFKNKK